MSHQFCGDCGRVIYSISKYGPVSLNDYSRVYCVCTTGRIDPDLFMDFMRHTPSKAEFKEMLKREPDTSETDE